LLGLKSRKNLHLTEMHDGPNQRGPLESATLRRLGNSVEVLGNIFYLLELHTEHPEQIEHFLALGKPALAELEDFVREEFARSGSK
jgi:hypothetical protein